MLSANLTHSDLLTYKPILTNLIIYFKCSLCNDTLIIPMGLVVAEIC